MELTPEQIANKTHGFWDHYYCNSRDWSAEKVIEEISKLIREYGDQQRETLPYEAVKYELGDCPHHKRPVTIEARDQIDGRRLWVVKMHEWVLGKDSTFHYEPRPSSRTDEFIQNTRFDSHQEAYQFWKTNITSKQDLYLN